MKRISIFCLLICSLFGQPDYRLMVDKDFSPFMGGENFLFGEHLLEMTYDYLIKPPATPQRGFIPSLGRAFELIAFWEPIGIAMSTVQHEVFGHGYRLRDIGRSKAQVDKYSFDWPPPYGSGGGATEFFVDEKYTMADDIATIIAGLEAQDIFARQIKLKSMATGVVNPRLSAAYNTSRQALLLYAAITDLGEVDVNDRDGNDISSYISSMNLSYPSDKLTTRGIKRKALLNLLDPMTLYSYVAAWKYIGTGTSTNLRMIRAGGLGFLPNWKVALAPYGIEQYLEGFFVLNGKPFYAYVKGGKHAGNTYGGVGLEWDRIWRWKRWQLGLRADVWRQPKFLLDTSFIEVLEGKARADRPELSETTYGASGSLVCAYGSDSVSLFADLGYKSRGYLPGYSLRAGATTRVGLSCQF